MRLLLDTHTWLWALSESPQLGVAARAAILDPDNEVMASAASAYEIALKVRQGRLPALPRSFAILSKENAFELTPITAEDAEAAGGLPLVVRDPFDRMIAAQAVQRGLVVATRDRAIAVLGARVIW